MKNYFCNDTVQRLAAQLQGELKKRVCPAPGLSLRLWGVPRGGTIAAYAVAGDAFQLVDRPEDADVIVDDVLDSGDTLRRYASHGKPFAVLIRKNIPGNLEGVGKVFCPEAGNYVDQWVVFPWETDVEPIGGEENFRRVLQAIGEDPHREGLRETPKRFLKALKEMTRGYDEDPKVHLKKNFDIQDVPTSTVYDQIIMSRDLPFVSLCEHHVLAFSGTAHIAYVPDPATRRVVGLSKLARVLDGYARRLQVQERLTTQIADAIEEVLKPLGVAVIIKGTHSCQCHRGVGKAGEMVTSAVHGVFKTDPSARSELMHLLTL